MPLAVLNPGGSDPDQRFPDLAGAPDDRAHAPVNYHAYAACTGGGFFRKVASIPAEWRHVLLLLRDDLKPSLRALRELKGAGKIVAVSVKESGLHQVAQFLGEAENLSRFRELCAQADGALASTPEIVELYRAAGARHAAFIPTPYPVEDARWDFSVPIAERRGVFIGTREWDVPTRNHAQALLLAATLGEPITVSNIDGRAGRKRLAALGLGDRLRVLEGRRSYPEYLRELARHRLVFQLDASAVPGQVAGDALLCRVPCVGGNGATDRVAFPHAIGAERALAVARELLTEPAGYRAAVESAQARALEGLSFTNVAVQIEEFFGSIPASAAG